jgi:hypothetical protein
MLSIAGVEGPLGQALTGKEVSVYLFGTGLLGQFIVNTMT